MAAQLNEHALYASNGSRANGSWRWLANRKSVRQSCIECTFCSVPRFTIPPAVIRRCIHDGIARVPVIVIVVFRVLHCTSYIFRSAVCCSRCNCDVGLLRRCS
jgi:hypothetical protein